MSSFDELYRKIQQEKAGSENGSSRTNETEITDSRKSTPRSYFEEQFEIVRSGKSVPREEKPDHSKEVNDWITRYNALMKGVSDYHEQLGNSWTDDYSGGYTGEIDALIADYEEIRSYAVESGFTEGQKALGQLEALKEQIGKGNDYMAQFSSEEAYNQAMAAWQEQERLRGMNLEDAQREIDRLEVVLEEYRNLSRWETDDRGRQRLDAIRQQYGDERQIQGLISQRTQDRNLAQRLQESEALAGVSQEADFGSYSGADRTVTNDLYRYINDVDGYRNTYRRGYALASGSPNTYVQETPFEQKGFHLMTDEERQLYNYHYKKSGKEQADAYLRSIQETLNQRKADQIFGDLENQTALEMVFGVSAGLDQAKSGITSLLSREDYIPQTAIQLASGMVRQDLEDTGGKLPQWLGGGSVGQAVYDTVTTTANMAPSILASVGMNLLVPGSGGIVGGALMGMGAAGNAYQEALNAGYDKGQARNYGMLIGASETVLSGLLGGIGALGGKLTGGAISAFLNKVDNAFLRTAIKLGGNALSEFNEEYLQEVLTPVFSNLTLMTDEEIRLLSPEALYAGVLGAVTAGILEGPGTIGDSVATYRTGADLMAAGVRPERLAELGSTFAADTAAAEIAGRVNANTDAYTMGRLFNEVGASLTEQNIADITNALTAKGMDPKSAQANARVLAGVVEGDTFTDSQIRIIQANDVLAEAVRTTLIDPNTTWNQRTSGYRELQRMAEEMATRGSVSKAAAPGSQAKADASTMTEAEKNTAPEDPSEADRERQVQNIQLRQGKAVVTFTDGTSGGVSSAGLSQEDAAVIETIATMEGISDSDANFLFHGVKGIAQSLPGADAVMVANAAKEAYRYGAFGMAQEHIGKYGVFSNYLTRTQQAEFWKAGNDSRKAKTTPAKTVKAKSGVYFADGAKVTDFEESGIGLSQKQRAGVETAQVLQRLGIGNGIYFFKSYVNAAGERVYRDASGEERTAPNGWYDREDGSIHIDLNAGSGGEGVTMFTLSHELIHFVEQWSPEKYRVLADFLVENYEKTGSMDDLVTAKRLELAEARGVDLQKIRYEEAYSECIADSMEAMLTDGNVLQRLTELKAKDKGLFEKIREFFDKLLVRIREAYEGIQPDSAEGRAVQKMEDAVGKIQELFAQALAEAGENLHFAMEEVVEENAEAYDPGDIWTDDMFVTDDDGTMYSIRSMKADIAEGKMFDDLMTHCGWTQEQVNRLRKDLTALVEYMTPFRDILDMNETYGREGRKFAPYKPNSDPLYKISMDFSTLCSKRLLTQYVIENLQLRENRPMTAEEQMAIRDMLIEYRKQEKGLQVACAMCYVEAARLKSPKQMQKWLNDPAPALRDYFAKKNKVFDASVKKAQEDFKESRGYARDTPKKGMANKDVTELNKIGPRMRSQYPLAPEEAEVVERAKKLPNSTYLTAGNLASLSESEPAIYEAYTTVIRNATRSKALETDEPYYYGDSRRDNGNGIVVTDSFIDAVNRENGMRYSSWSDWRIQHMLDYITAVIDNAVRGAAMHGYTKFPEEVRVLGKTGMMFNMSGVPGTQTGLNPDGSLSFSPTESIDKDEAVQLREELPETAGLQCIGVSDEHIRTLLKSDIIDYVIPYHTSGLNKGLRTMVKIQGWKDYTGTQNASVDKSIKKEDAADPEHWHEEPKFSEFFVGYNTGMTGIEAMKASAERYRQMCRDRGLIPKFDQFYEEGNNYWKLLIDRKMINQKTGQLIRQRAVTPTFDFDTIRAVVDRHVANYDSGLEARALNHIVKNWDAIPGRIKELKKAKKAGNKKTAAAMTAVNTVANEMLAAQRKEGEKQFSIRRDIVDVNGKEYDAVVELEYGVFNKIRRKTGSFIEFIRNNLINQRITVHNSNGETEIIEFAGINERVQKDGAKNSHRVLGELERAQGDIKKLIIANAQEVIEISRIKNNPEAIRNHQWLDQNGWDKGISYVMTRAGLIYPATLHIAKTRDGRNILYSVNVSEKEGIGIDKEATSARAEKLVQQAVKVPTPSDRKNLSQPEGKVKAKSGASQKQERSASGSNREILANAFEEVAQTPYERSRIREYKKEARNLDEQQRKLEELNRRIQEIETYGGPKAEYDRLREEARKTANAIDIYDRRLIRLEASEPLRQIVQRERSKAEEQRKELVERHKASKKREVDSRRRTVMRQKIRKTVRELDKILNRGTKQRNVKDGLRELAQDALTMADVLLTDNMDPDEVLMKGFLSHLESAEISHFEKAQDALFALRNNPNLPVYRRQELENSLRYHKSRLTAFFARERTKRNEVTVSKVVGDLADTYAKLQNSQAQHIQGAYQEEVHQHLLWLKEYCGGTLIRDMNLAQLEQLHDAFKMVLTTVRNANKLFATNMKATTEETAKSVMQEVERSGKKPGARTMAADRVDTFAWNNLKPVYAFERLGSETLKRLYANIRKGQDVWARDMQEANAFRQTAYAKHGWKNWDRKKTYAFTTGSGDTFSLTLEQIMTLYAYSRREQAHAHLMKGGFVFDTVIEKKKFGITTVRRDATAHNLSLEDLQQIIDTLTPEQMAFVEEMQGYLSDTMGQKGNAVSTTLYGIKLFNEANYFPLRSAGQYMAKAKEADLQKEQGMTTLAGSGFAKPTVPKAGNPVVLSGFMDVWADHVSEMSMYHGFVLPMEDFRRVYNFSRYYDEESKSVSVNSSIENAFGKAAIGYIDQLFRDLNSGSALDTRAGLLSKLISNTKKGATFASLSVAVQQPSAILRAMALVDSKYFIDPRKVDSKWFGKQWEQLKQFAPVAFIKEMGRFDTHMGRSATDYLMAEEYEKFGEKFGAFFKDSDYRDEVLGKLPEWADQRTWCAIWDAVKRETKARYPELSVSSEEFLKIAGDRFSDVIDRTQVYDSVLSRSANMRSKDTGMTMVTAFMAEPTTTINMLEDALRKGKKGQRKYRGRVIRSLIASAVLNSILVSSVHALRDDDDDETYWEKYLSALISNAGGALNPLGYITFVKDILSILQGYDVERMDMSQFKDIMDEFNRLGNKDVSLWRKVEGFAGSICQLFGIPLKNIMRDVRAAYQTVNNARKGEKGTWAGTGYAAMEGLGFRKPRDGEQLLRAILTNDSEHQHRVENRFEDEKKRNSAVRSAIRDQFKSGKTNYDETVERLVSAAGMEDADAWWTVAEWEYEMGSDEDFRKYDAFIDAVRSGENLEEIIQRYTEHDVKPETLSDQITDELKPEYIAMVEAERPEMREKLKTALIATGVEEDKAEQRLAEWDFEANHGLSYNDMTKAYREGTMERTELKAVLLERGLTEKEADAKLDDWDFERENGWSYSERRSLYLEGQITDNQLRDALMEMGDMSREEADAQIEVYKLEQQGYTAASVSRVLDYNTYCAGAGVSVEHYYQIVEVYANTKNSDTDSGYKRDTVMRSIHRLPISAAQKTAIALAFWSEKTVKKYKPW